MSIHSELLLPNKVSWISMPTSVRSEENAWVVGMPHPICQVGDPILTAVATPVEDVHDPLLQHLIDELLVTVKAANGVGIAAPQVGVSQQLIIIASRPTLRYPHAPVMDPLPLINPRLLWQSDQQVWGWEGCLSVPDQRGLVARSEAIGVEYTSRSGQQVTMEWTDFVARIFQHEYDHLQGKVFLDRQPQALLSEADYQAQIVDLNRVS
jgi:peptide deformylase